MHRALHGASDWLDVCPRRCHTGQCSPRSVSSWGPIFPTRSLLRRRQPGITAAWQDVISSSVQVLPTRIWQLYLKLQLGCMSRDCCWCADRCSLRKPAPPGPAHRMRAEHSSVYHRLQGVAQGAYTYGCWARLLSWRHNLLCVWPRRLCPSLPLLSIWHTGELCVPAAGCGVK